MAEAVYLAVPSPMLSHEPGAGPPPGTAAGKAAKHGHPQAPHPAWWGEETGTGSPALGRGQHRAGRMVGTGVKTGPR